MQGIAGPPANWPLGSLRELGRGTLAFYRGLHRQYGDLARFHIGPVPAYLVTQPAAVLALLRVKASELARRSCSGRHPCSDTSCRGTR